MIVETIPSGELDLATDVLADAFRDYPVMRYVLGESHDGARLRLLLGYFVRARAARRGPLLGLRDESGAWAAVAAVTIPDQPAAPPELVEWGERVWAELGAESRARYRHYSTVGDPFDPAEPHHHLNMIGVRRDRQGRGLAGVLLAAVHAEAARDPRSTGVSLVTELAENVALYERFGYRVLGRTRVTDSLESWTMFRARGESPAGT